MIRSHLKKYYDSFVSLGIVSTYKLNMIIKENEYVRSYECHVDINSTFCSTNEGAIFYRFALMICAQPFLSITSSFMETSCFSSHTIY